MQTTNEPTMQTTHELTMPITQESTMPTTHEPVVQTSPVMRVNPAQSNKFYFVRHGATEPNLRELRCGGDLDLPMSDLGREQARASAARIVAMNLGIGLIVSSTLKRTREHASILSKALGGVPIIVEPLLDERRMGEWNLRSVATTEVLLAQGIAPPRGETEAAIVARVTEAFQRFPTLLPLNPLVVSSRAVARVLNLLLGGTGRLNLSNGEIHEFTMQPLVSPPVSEPK